MTVKPIFWIASSKDDLRAMPAMVRDEIGYALHRAQEGGRSDKAKPFKGFGSAAVLEIVEDDIGGTYRAVYTVKFKEAIFVLHVFQKKSKRGIATTRQDINLIKSRFKLAEHKYKLWLLEGEGL